MAGREDEEVAVVQVQIEALLLSMKQKLEVFDGREPETEYPCTIFRVLSTVRREDPAAYNPKIISIGPFHSAKKELKPMEPIKWKFLHDLLHRSPDNSLNGYIDQVRSLEPQARKRYSEPVNLGSNTFVEMLVLDGCFIIEFLVKSMLGSHDGELYAVNWNLPLIMNDLLLLENQIPFFVLQSLFDNSDIPELRTVLKDGDSTPITLTELAACVMKTGLLEIPDATTVHHLLYLFHLSLRPTQLGTSEISGDLSCCQLTLFTIKKTKQLISNFFLWLLSTILYCYCRRSQHREESSPAPRTIPSATELSAAGVKFLKKEANCFLDVTFAKGVMEIPLLSVQASTIPQFRNLMAFEQCCPASGSHFTSYVALIDNLIDTPSDVAVLEGCGVLESKLGGDEEVARFFNSLGKGGYLHYETHYFVGVFRDVKGFYAKRSHRWRAMLMRDYFSNPWAIISLVAALVLLLLTMLQTFFAIFSYFRSLP